MWNDVTNPIQLEHLEIGDNEWFVDGNYFNSNYTDNFKWNIFVCGVYCGDGNPFHRNVIWQDPNAIISFFGPPK